MAIIDYEKELKDIQSQLDTLEKRKKEIVADIKKQFSESKTTNYGVIQVQITAPYFTLEFDLEKFKEENKELYEQYLIPVSKSSIVKVVVQKTKESKQ